MKTLTAVPLAALALLAACDPAYRAAPIPLAPAPTRRDPGPQVVYRREGLELRATETLTLLCSASLPLHFIASASDHPWTVSLARVTDVAGKRVAEVERMELAVRPDAQPVTAYGALTLKGDDNCPLRRLPAVYQVHLRIADATGTVDSAVVRFRRTMP